MNHAIPRLRLFAGPNGSGKATVKEGLRRTTDWFGTYINPDEIERSMKQSGSLMLEPLGLSFEEPELSAYLALSPVLQADEFQRSILTAFVVG